MMAMDDWANQVLSRFDRVISPGLNFELVNEPI